MKYPLIRKYTGKYEDYLREDTDKKFWLVNTNKLVRFYPGVDGVKTGFTTEAKYCLTASAEKMACVSFQLSWEHQHQKNGTTK